LFRIRRSVKRKLIAMIGGFGIGLVLVFGTFYFTRQHYKKKYEPVIAELRETISSKTRVGYVTTRRVCAGEQFSAENTEKRTVFTEEEQLLLATEVLGLLAGCDLEEGSILEKGMCLAGAYDDTERECVFRTIGNAEDFEEYSLVDVRIRYPNGENYCVLKEKRLLKGARDGESRLMLSEEEQILISAALYDLDTYKGAEIYYVKFAEELQKNTDSCYVPPLSSIALLLERPTATSGADITWYAAREKLEKRQTEAKEKALLGNR